MRPELLLALAGCGWAGLLEAPLILAGGLDRPTAMSAVSADALAVVTGQGIMRVGLNGEVSTLHPGQAAGVAAHVKRLYRLVEDGVSTSGIGDTVNIQKPQMSPRPVDLTAWCDDTVLLLQQTAVLQWKPADGSTQPWAVGGSDWSVLAPGEQSGCKSVLIGTASGEVIRVSPTERRTLARDLGQVRAVSSDAHGRVWTLHGAPVRLSEIRDAKAHEITRRLGVSVDLFVLTAPARDGEHAYVSDGVSSIDMIQLPPHSEAK